MSNCLGIYHYRHAYVLFLFIYLFIWNPLLNMTVESHYDNIDISMFYFCSKLFMRQVIGQTGGEKQSAEFLQCKTY